MKQTKPFSIIGGKVWWKLDEPIANKGAAGLDEQPIEAFEEDLKDNGYKL